MKTKFILHGGFTRYDNEQNRAFYKEFVKDVPDGGTVLIVMFASREDDPNEVYNALSSKFASGAPEKKFDFILADKEEFIEQLGTAGAIYYQGGSTSKLMKAMHEYDLEELKKAMAGKTLAGSSAGAYALASYGPAHDRAEIRTGLGIWPAKIVCHFESPELPPNAEAVAKLEAFAPELELFKLKDCEWVVKEIEL